VKAALFAAVLGLAAFGDASGARPSEDAEVVGSSTVYPFASEVEARLAGRGTPLVVTPTGTSAGVDFFCSGAGPDYPGVVMASRRIKPTELEYCRENGVDDVEEIVIGRSGIVIAQRRGLQPLAITRRDLFLAAAAMVPTSEEDCGLKPNDAAYWSDIRPELPRRRIQILGPPLSSGTRESLRVLALEPGAERIPCLAALRARDRGAFDRIVRMMRVDGAWVDAGENDAAIAAAILRLDGALGVFGFARFANSEGRLRAAKIEGVAPAEETIRSGEYPLARTLYIYAKSDAARTRPAIAAFLAEFRSEDAVGETGYLRRKSLIPVAVHR